ncbi:hypothetical protein L1887_07350 [Cichorium endivia]|nr:hypothetical protein L1887_07350 [Cichorium endivia]
MHRGIRTRKPEIGGDAHLTRGTAVDCAQREGVNKQTISSGQEAKVQSFNSDSPNFVLNLQIPKLQTISSGQEAKGEEYEVIVRVSWRSDELPSRFLNFFIDGMHRRGDSNQIEEVCEEDVRKKRRVGLFKEGDDEDGDQRSTN